MAAALTAASEGLSTLVVEKASVYGGTTSLSGGVLWVPNNSLMRAAGISDSPADALTYLTHNIGNRVERARLEAFVANAPKMADFIVRNSSVRWRLLHDFPDYRPETPGGRSGGRSIEPSIFPTRRLPDPDKLGRRAGLMPGGIVASVGEMRNLAFAFARPINALKAFRVFPRNLLNRVARRGHVGTGGALIAALRKALFDAGVPIWVDAPLQDLLQNESGRIVGATIQRGDKVQTVHANKGVVLAAGGFDRNQDMRRRYFPATAGEDWLRGRNSAGAESNTGDAIAAGERIGAATDLMDDLWWIPSSSPPGGGAMIHVFERALPHLLMVNAKGKRFANEALPYNELGRIMFENDAPPIFVVFDSEYHARFAFGTVLPNRMPQRLVDEGYVRTSESLEKLATDCGIDPAGLVAEVDRFNAMARDGRDTDFHKGESAFDIYAGDPGHRPNPCLGTVAKAPFYAVEVKPGDLGTKGGLLTNANAQVLRNDGRVIEGLYAAGNCSASAMGNFYPGAGGTIAPAMTFGYIAGLHAARA